MLFAWSAAWRGAAGWLAALAATGSLAAAEPTLRWDGESHPPCVEVLHVAPGALRELSGLAPADPAWGRTLAVFAEQEAGAIHLPPMLGEWRIAGDRLRFTPRYPLARGVRYRAEFRPAAGPPVVSYFELPADPTPPSTRVVQVYPSGDVLPENQLKFYVEFSAPMNRGSAYEHVRLRDDTGAAIELAFLELDEELWDPAMRRLTLLIDPGRIKRGVRPLEEVGPVFVAGRTYALTVGVDLRDAAGRPLQAAFAKRFRAGPADRTPPDPARWRLTPPKGGTRQALEVEFDEPMDSALARRMLEVVRLGAPDQGVSGRVTLARNECHWSFVPDEPWARGRHQLAVATTIEDLAGNNIGKLFDVDAFERVNRRLEVERVRVAFAVE